MEFGQAPSAHFEEYIASEVHDDVFGVVPEAEAEAPADLLGFANDIRLPFKPDPADLTHSSEPLLLCADVESYQLEPNVKPAVDDEDNVDPEDYTPSGMGGLTVLLFHKTRGGKGAWLPISTMQLIRVTKGIGKRLRMEIRSVEPLTQPSDVQLHLYDVLEDHSLAERDFTIETSEISHAPDAQGSASMVTLELKVFHLCKNLQFHASVAPPSGQQLKGTSVQFSTHDSGKQRKRSPTIQVDMENVSAPVSVPGPSTTQSSGTLTPTSSAGSSSPRQTLDSSQETALSNPSPIVRIILTPKSPLSQEDNSKPASVEAATPESIDDRMDVSDPTDSSAFPSASEPDQDSPDESLSSDDNTSRSGSKKRKIDHDLSIPVQSGFQHFCPGSLDVHGIVRAQGFVQYSDIRLKTNVEDIMDALQIVTQLQGKRYQWRDGFNMSEELSGGRKVIGLIAQEVKRVLPEVVVEDKGGFLAVNYADLVPLLVEALKQHVQTYESDKKEIKTEINELREKLDSIAVSNPQKSSHVPPSPPRPSLTQRGLLLTPGYKRPSQDHPLAEIESAVIIALSGWTQWSAPATSNPSVPNRLAAESICRAASEELQCMYPSSRISTHALLMGTSIRDTIEDVTALFLSKSKIRQDLEQCQLVWLVGESHGVVPLTVVCDKLIQLGLLSSARQHINLLSIGGIHHHCSTVLAVSHPNPFVQTGLHNFSCSEDFQEYKEAMGSLVEHGGVSVTLVGAYEDSLVDLSSSLCDQAQHPNILRAVYVSEEHRPLFSPSHVIRMADNVPQEMLHFSLELKNSGRELDIVPCLVGCSPASSIDSDSSAVEILMQNHKSFSSLKLHQCLFGSAEMPSTVASFYYALGSTFSMFSSWGYSFFKHVQSLRAGLLRHQAMFSSPDVFRVSLEWLSRPPEHKMVASTRKMLFRDIYSRASSPISPRHKLGSMFDLSEQLDPATAQWVYAVKKLEVQFGTERTSRLRSSFRYWTPSLPKEQALQRAMQKHLGWGVRASLFGICPGQFLDGFAERVAAEKEREMQRSSTPDSPAVLSQ